MLRIIIQLLHGRQSEQKMSMKLLMVIIVLPVLLGSEEGFGRSFFQSFVRSFSIIQLVKSDMAGCISG
jgi:hypothetical protein